MTAPKFILAKKIIGLIKSHRIVCNNMLWLFTERLLSVGLALLCSAILARSLSNSQFGKWQYAQSIAALFSSMSLFAGAEVAIPILARNKKIISTVVSSTFLLRLFGAFIVLPICLGVLKILGTDRLVTALILFFLMQIALGEAFGVIGNYFQATINIRPVSICRLTALAGRSLIFVLAYIFSKDMTAFVAAMFLELLITIMLLLSLARKWHIRWSPQIRPAWIILKRGSFFWPGLVLMYAFLRADRIYIEHIFSYVTVGQFSVAQQLVEQGFTLIIIAVQSLAPKYIFSRQSNKELIGKLMKICIILMITATCLSLLAASIGPWFLHYMYGEKFATSGRYFHVMCFAMIPYALDAVLNQVLLREKAAKLLLAKWLVSVICMYIVYTYFSLYFDQDNLGYIYLINFSILAGLSILCTGMLFFRHSNIARHFFRCIRI